MKSKHEESVTREEADEKGGVTQSGMDTVMGLELEVAVRLSGLQLSVEKLLSLAVGQSITYRFDPRAAVLLEIDNQAIAQASFAKDKGITSLKIERLLGEASDAGEQDGE